jgi:hypothetical protein
MVRRMLAGSLVASLLLVVTPRAPFAWGAPCVQACKPLIAACIGAQCAGLTRKALRHCRRMCAKTIVRDCYGDLSVCGATTARPTRPGGGTPGGAPPPPTGGW